MPPNTPTHDVADRVPKIEGGKGGVQDVGL